MTRRDLLLGAGAAVAFRSSTIELLARCADTASRDPFEAARDEEYWAQVRRAFKVETEFLYLNHGGICPTSERVLDAAVGHMRAANASPAYRIYRQQEKRTEAVRKRLAGLFHCDPEELAIMPNASQGLFTSIMGCPVGAGEIVVSTDQDYPRVVTACRQRVRRERIRFMQVSMPVVPQDVRSMVTPFENVIYGRPRLVALPRIGYLNGTLFPCHEVAELSKRNGALVLVDGAHGIGQLDDSPASIGCDMYACCLHKWLLGPLGTGFLYIRRDLLKGVWPLYPADGDLDGDIRKFEQFGTRNAGIVLAVEQALDAHEAIGVDRKAARLEYLRAYWTSALRDVPKVRFYTALDPALSRAMATVGVDGIEPVKLAGWLFDKHRIYVTTAIRGEILGVRVSAQVFTAPKELDHLVAALREAATAGIG